MRNEGTAPGLRERKKQATRAALAEAAVRLAAEHGAENVTVEAISEAAGVSPRTFFNYFDCHDDAFVMAHTGSGERIRRAVREAPAGLTPLEAVRDALAAELADVEEQQEIWHLRAKVHQRSPHLLMRGLGVHTAEEILLANAIAERIGATPAVPGTPGVPGRGPCEGGPDTSALDLYPRLLAAVAMTAVRVCVEHWFSRDRSVPFPDIFRRLFAHLAAGLPPPPSADDRTAPVTPLSLP
ncbi:TetR/AcrR family transcriptional regulator [Streptomyces sp. NPDC087658]|uniref:TetR/AcrR family transcriptional regulator n=1 Tax=Streptomyces sp. NPDC087658 TaxID=3365800 RepID=UPI00381950EB